MKSVASKATAQSPECQSKLQMLSKDCESKGQYKSTIPSLDFRRFVVRAAEQEVDVPLWRVEVVFRVLGIVDSTRKLRSHGACRQTTRKRV